MSAPRSKTDLFWAFTVLAMQGFGGVLAVVPKVDTAEHPAQLRAVIAGLAGGAGKGRA